MKTYSPANFPSPFQPIVQYISQQYQQYLQLKEIAEQSAKEVQSLQYKYCCEVFIINFEYI